MSPLYWPSKHLTIQASFLEDENTKFLSVIAVGENRLPFYRVPTPVLLPDDKKQKQVHEPQNGPHIWKSPRTTNKQRTSTKAAEWLHDKMMMKDRKNPADDLFRDYPLSPWLIKQRRHWVKLPNSHWNEKWNGMCIVYIF